MQRGHAVRQNLMLQASSHCIYSSQVMSTLKKWFKTDQADFRKMPLNVYFFFFFFLFGVGCRLAFYLMLLRKKQRECIGALRLKASPALCIKRGNRTPKQRQSGENLCLENIRVFLVVIMTKVLSFAEKCKCTKELAYKEYSCCLFLNQQISRVIILY